MSIMVPKTDKDFILMVNRTELYKKALELGYESIVFPDSEELREDDLKALSECGKLVVCYFFQTEYVKDIRCQKWLDSMRENNIKTKPIYFEDNMDDGDENLSIDELAAKLMMPFDKMDRFLKSNGYILDDDFSNRCGNCHSLLYEGMKYCIYCGTRRGEGAFKPFMNINDALYGSPTKIKKRCSKCGCTWISYEFSKGEEFKFCPQCGNKDPRLEELRKTNMFSSYDAGGIASYTNESRPRLLSEDQVLTILNEREKGYDPEYNREDMEKLIDKTGIRIFSDISDYESRFSEIEAETLNHIMEVYRAKGEDQNGYPGTFCPHCGSSLIAGIGQYADGKTIYPASNSNDPIRIDGHTGIVRGPNKKDITFLCMCCSEEFS